MNRSEVDEPRLNPSSTALYQPATRIVLAVLPKGR